jgi:hypothetical protein
MHKLHRSVGRVLAAAASFAFLVASSPSLAVTITVNGPGACAAALDGAGNVTVNCASATGPTCSVSASPNPVPAAGGSVTLTSNCGAVTSWGGDAAALAAGPVASWSDTYPANTSASPLTVTYTLSGANGTAQTTVTQLGTGSPPPPPPPPGSCTSIPGITNVKTIALPWATTIGTGVSTAKVGFGPNDAIVFVVTPPVGTTTSGNYVQFKQSPTGPLAYNSRMVSISTVPCDFSRSMGPGSVSIGQEVPLYFSVGGYPIGGRLFPAPITTNANLTGGTTYYISVINQTPLGTGTCTSSACDVNYGLVLP